MIVVTGATGFIGSNLLAGLEMKWYDDIVGIDSFGTGDKWKNVANRDNVKFIDPDDAFAFLEKNKNAISALVHLGAISSTMENNVDLIVKNNIQLSIGLYEFCKQNGISFIYASSAATYGQRTPSDTCNDDDSIDYLRKLHPLNPYGWSKLYVDKHIAINKAKTNPSNQIVGLKFFNVYGPNEYHKGNQASVILHFYEQLRGHGVAKVFKTASTEYPKGASRDFVYVDDCVNVILWMLEHKNVSGLFNVGTGVSVTYEEIADDVALLMGLKPSIEYIEMPQHLHAQYQYFTEAQLNKLRSVGYDRAMTDIHDGISSYYYYLTKTNSLKYK